MTEGPHLANDREGDLPPATARAVRLAGLSLVWERLWPRLDAWGQRQKAAAWVAGQAAGEGFVALDVVPVGNAGARDTAAR